MNLLYVTSSGAKISWKLPHHVNWREAEIVIKSGNSKQLIEGRNYDIWNSRKFLLLPYIHLLLHAYFGEIVLSVSTAPFRFICHIMFVLCLSSACPL